MNLEIKRISEKPQSSRTSANRGDVQPTPRLRRMSEPGHVWVPGLHSLLVPVPLIGLRLHVLLS
jgi:hypothetical protein